MNKVQFHKDKNNLVNLLSPMLIVCAAVLFLSVLLVLVGNNPWIIFGLLIKGAFGSSTSIINTISKSVPICFSALAVGLAKKAGVFNIGVEGQLVFGAFGCTLAGIFIQGLPPAIHILVSLLAGMIFGALYALLPTFMFIKRGVNLLVVFILMNNIARLIITFFVIGPFADPAAMTSSTSKIQKSAYLPNLITQPAKLNIGIIIALVICIMIYLFIYKSTMGYELRACGMNREAAKYAGIPTNKYLFFALITGGLLAGLAGGVEVLGTYYRLYDGFSPGYGFDGIPIALLANGNPVGIMLGSIIFGAIRVGSMSLQLETNISGEMVSIIQGTLVTLIACEYIMRYLASKIVSRRRKELH